MEGLNLKQSCITALGLLLLGLEKDEEFPHLISTVCIECCLGPSQQPPVRKLQLTATLQYILLEIWLFILLYVAFGNLVFWSIY